MSLRHERIAKAAIENPDLCIDLLCERFGATRGEIVNVLFERGIRRERDYFSDDGRQARKRRTA